MAGSCFLEMIILRILSKFQTWMPLVYLKTKTGTRIFPTWLFYKHKKIRLPIQLGIEVKEEQVSVYPRLSFLPRALVPWLDRGTAWPRTSNATQEAPVNHTAPFSSVLALSRFIPAGLGLEAGWAGLTTCSVVSRLKPEACWL